jgi:predicted AAA+ superfamily ATPase
LKCRDAAILTWDEEGEEKAGDLTVKIMPIWKWLTEILPLQSILY